MEQNQVCREIAFIHKGILRSFYINQPGQEVTSCFCIAGKMTSSLKSFLSQQPSELAILALDKTALLTIG